MWNVYDILTTCVLIVCEYNFKLYFYCFQCSVFLLSRYIMYTILWYFSWKTEIILISVCKKVSQTRCENTIQLIIFRWFYYSCHVMLFTKYVMSQWLIYFSNIHIENICNKAEEREKLTFFHLIDDCN